MSCTNTIIRFQFWQLITDRYHKASITSNSYHQPVPKSFKKPLTGSLKQENYQTTWNLPNPKATIMSNRSYIRQCDKTTSTGSWIQKFNPRGVQTPLGRKWLWKIGRQEEESGWRWVASRTRHVSAEKFAAVGSRQQVASHTAAQPSFESNRSIFLLAYWLPPACFSSGYFTRVQERVVPGDTCLSSTSGHRNATLVDYADFRNDHALHRREIGYRSW